MHSEKRDSAPTHANWYFLDESGFGRHTARRSHAWSRRGDRAIVREPLIQGQNITLLSCIGVDGVVLQQYSKGGYNTERFMHYVERVLPHLPWGATLVMDNAPIHKACVDWMQRVAALQGIVIVFLPPYSPDYNPIETFFKNVKGELRGPKQGFI